MATSFDQEQVRTAGKKSDLMMESVSQLIARDYLEAYERVLSDERYTFVPAEFDDKIYRKISKHIKKKTGYNIKIFRVIVKIAVAAVCLSCIAFTIAVLLNDGLRHEVFSVFGI